VTTTSEPASISSPVNLLYMASGAAGIVSAAMLFVAAASLLVHAVGSSSSASWSWIGNNWLTLLLRLHAGSSDVHSNMLNQLSAMDLAIMALVCILFISLYLLLRKTSKVWSIVALAQSALGMVLFLATRTAGRSAVMGAVLVISFVMIWSGVFGRVLAVIGIVGSAF
jgi:hypothetical protein